MKFTDQQKKEIYDIIEDTVDVTDGPYGWGGATIILTDIDKAVAKIEEYITTEE